MTENDVAQYRRALAGTEILEDALRVVTSYGGAVGGFAAETLVEYERFVRDGYFQDREG